jgi:hypothetical protein
MFAPHEARARADHQDDSRLARALREVIRCLRQ